MAEKLAHSTGGVNVLTNLGGSINHTPLVLSRSDSQTDIFHIGIAGKLYVSSRNGDYTSPFRGWKEIDSQLTSTLAGVCWDSTRMDIFATGAGNNFLMHKWFDGTWHDFETINVKDVGGPITVLGDITVATFGPNTLFVFFRNMANWIDGVYWNRLQNCWSRVNVPQEWGFHLSGTPKVAAFKQGNNYRIDIFGRDVWNQVRYKTLVFSDLDRPMEGVWTPAEQSWSTLGGEPVISDVTVIHVINQHQKWRTHLISRNKNNQIVRRTISQETEASGWTPTAGWDVCWGLGLCPVQAVVGANWVTLVVTGDFNVISTAQLDFEGNYSASWLRMNIPPPEGVNMADHPVLHPRGGPSGWLTEGTSIPLEVFFKAADTSLQKLIVRQEEISPNLSKKI